MEKFSGYMSHAWGDLKQDKRWWQPMLILTLVNFIPIVGPMITMGYFYDWAKEASWGLTKPLTRKVGDVGRRLKYGFFAVVISLVWTLPVYLVGLFLRVIPVLGGLIYFCCQIIGIIAAVVAEPATLRALTYERIAPGFHFGRILKMARRDAGGLLRCFCIGLIGSLIVFAIMLIVLIPIGVVGILGATAGAGVIDSGAFEYGYGGYGLDYDDIEEFIPNSSYTPIAALVAMLVAALPVLLVVLFVVTFIGTLFTALATRAYGYWLGQFKPSEWGTPDDAMPFEREGDASATAQPQAPYTQQPAGSAPAGAPDGQPASTTTEPDRQAQPRPQGFDGGADTCDAASEARGESSTAPSIPDESCADVPNAGAVEQGSVEDGYYPPQEVKGAVQGSERKVLDAATDDAAEGKASGWRSASNGGVNG